MRECEGKQKFASMRIAKQTAHRQSKRHHGKFNAYRCRHCNAFHVGSITGQPLDERKELKYAETQ